MKKFITLMLLFCIGIVYSNAQVMLGKNEYQISEYFGRSPDTTLENNTILKFGSCPECSFYILNEYRVCYEVGLCYPIDKLDVIIEYANHEFKKVKEYNYILINDNVAYTYDIDVRLAKGYFIVYVKDLDYGASGG